MPVVSNNGFSIRFLTNLSPKEACKRLKAALENEGLEVLDQFDLSAHIENRTGLTPEGKYTVLTVCSSLDTYHALLASPEAGVFLPFHVLLTPYNNKTLIAIVRPEWLAEVVDKLSFRLLAMDVSEKYKRALGALEAAEPTRRPLEPNAISG
jgi:uncharacterized protein (DUF302 family)